MTLLPLVAVCVGFFLVVLDTTVLNVALPDVARSFGSEGPGRTASLQWIVNAYTVALAGLILSGGALGDRFGARRVYAAGLAVFTLASVACSLAGGPGTLMAARAFQGLGAAALLPTSVSLITAGYPDPSERSRALGVWGAVAGVAFAGGPLLGGLLVGGLGWRSIFLLNVPAGLWALWAVHARLPRPGRPAPRAGPLDLPGQLLVMLALTGVTAGLITLGSPGQSGPGRSAGLLGGGAALLAAFVWRERVARAPLLPLTLYARRSFALGSLAGFAYNFGEYGLLFVLSLTLQQAHHLTALQTGLALLPLTFVSACTTLVGGRLAARWGARPPLVLGLLLMSSGLVLAGLGAGSAGPLLYLGMVLFGAGSGAAVPPLMSLALTDVPQALGGVGAAALNAARQAGSAVGVAALGLLLALTGGASVPLELAALICVLGALAAWAVRPDANRPAR